MQTTIKHDITFEGVGLHSGAPAKLVIRPAGVDAGLMFRRVD
ncbi:MAG TPA: UDP-3-O-[3-hydroxymyristoyl] N-acetylglucosamine deacetylase, partial [Roseovarius nubinhibens]|nr:UDP-3-O-[3-hydroxymyristoyl] N-acetylglucosamine deacetylase [Roseovarius nubinhibens]